MTPAVASNDRDDNAIVVPPRADALPSTTAAQLAPRSAHASLKRARLLFDVDSPHRPPHSAPSSSPRCDDDDGCDDRRRLACATYAFVPPLYERDVALREAHVMRRGCREWDIRAPTTMRCSGAGTRT